MRRKLAGLWLAALITSGLAGAPMWVTFTVATAPWAFVVGDHLTRRRVQVTTLKVAPGEQAWLFTERGIETTPCVVIDADPETQQYIIRLTVNQQVIKVPGQFLMPRTYELSP